MYDDVGRVSADLAINGKELSPEEVTAILGVPYDYAHRIGDPIMNTRGEPVGARLSNYWKFGSSNLVHSKDLDEHLRALLAIFVPRADAVHEIAQRAHVFFWTQWQSEGLILGAGPIISPATARDIGILGVELHFDIFCMLEHFAPEPELKAVRPRRGRR